MIAHIKLLSFCKDIEQNGFSLKTPFNLYGYTWAISGVVGIRIKAIPRYKRKERVRIAKSLIQLWPIKTSARYKPVGHINYQDKIYVMQYTCVELYGVLYQYDMIKKFTQFKNLKISVRKIPKNRSVIKPSLLKFDGGEGIIMPVRDQR